MFNFGAEILAVIDKIIKYIIVLLCVSTASFAQISASDTTGCAPLTGVVFTSPAGASNHNWDFGDLTSANTASPTHTYSSPGTYNVVYNGTVAGSPVTENLTITVFGKPSPAFSAQPLSGCIPLDVQFTDLSTGGGGTNIKDWAWTFGDGGSSSTQSPLYTYTLLGDFNVSLVVTDDNGCDSALIVTDMISTANSPNASFTTNPNPPIACVPPLNVSFTNNSTAGSGGNLTYSWDFGNGNTSTAQNPPAENYTVNGTFPVKLVVSEAGGCADSMTVNVVVDNPTASFLIPNDTICIGTSYQFINNSLGANTYIWDFGDATSSVQVNPFKSYNAAGTYDITLTANSNAGCSDDTTITIFVQEVIADFSRTPTYYCDFPYCVNYTNLSQNADSYFWWFEDLDTSTAVNPNHCFSKPDTSEFTVYDTLIYVDTLYAYSNAGCMAKTFRIDTVFPITALLNSDVFEGCAPLTVNLSDSSKSNETIISWDWDFGDGNTASGQNQTHTFTNPGEYDVVLWITNSAGCQDTSYALTIRVGAPTNPNFSALPASVCSGDTVDFTDLSTDPNIDTWHYDSDGSQVSSCQDESSTSWTYTSRTGFHDVTLTTGYNGCYDDTTIANAVEVKGPINRLVYDALCASPLEYNFTGEIWGADTWTWDYGDGNTELLSVDSTVTHTYAASGNYWAKITGNNLTSGCPDYVDSVLVKVRDLQAVINTDSVFCQGSSMVFNGAASVDEQGCCHNTYRWDWDDGTPYNMTSDTTYNHSFADTGIYNVRLITLDVNGCKDTAFFDVKVFNIHAGFSTDTTFGCMPLTINFTDTTNADTTISNLSWNFDDGSFGNGANVSHTYTDVSNSPWTVILTATDVLGCSDTAMRTITPIIPDTTFSAVSDRTICIGDSVRFVANGGGNDTMYWNFGDGTQVSTTSNSIWHTFNTVGSFDITLTVLDTFGCSGSYTRQTYVSTQAYPDANFITNADTIASLCYPFTANFVDTGVVNITSWTWDLGNGAPVVSSPTVATTYNAPGMYDVELITSTSFGCKDTTNKTINVVGPVANFSMDDSLICVGESITFAIKDTVDVETWSWDFGDGSIAGNDPTITHTFDFYLNGGQTSVTLTYWSEDSICSFSTQKVINMHDAYANFGLSDTVLCLGTTLAVVDSSGGADTWDWIVSNGTTYSGQNIPNINFSSVGTYTVTQMISDNQTSCKDTLTKSLDVVPLPDLQVSNAAICDGDSVLMIATGGSAYQWTPADDLSHPNNDSTWAFPSQTTTYMVVSTDTNGCIQSANPVVAVFNQLNPLKIDTCIVIGEKHTIGRDLGSGYYYDWTLGDTVTLSCTDCALPEVTVLNDILLVVEVGDTLGCFNTQDEYELCMLPYFTVDVPGAFTPDGDGNNDVIYVRGWGIRELKVFRIFNRWGEIVYEGTDINEGWNGYYKGTIQNMDSFVYYVEVEFHNGKTENKTGNITLIR